MQHLGILLHAGLRRIFVSQKNLDHINGPQSITRDAKDRPIENSDLGHGRPRNFSCVLGKKKIA